MERRIMRRMATIATRIAELGLVIPVVPGPFGAYVPAKRSGNLLFVAGQLPMKDGKLVAVGALPSTATLEDGRRAARQCVLNGLAAALTTGIELDAIVGVVRVGVFVSCHPTFHRHSEVANAASELLLDLFGEAGRHARAAVGVASLPLDASVEIDFVFEVH
jgi:enamine deaminase RidA (YjgF/YER057c/UK114 family)